MKSNILIIGGGNMGTAIANGLLRNNNNNNNNNVTIKTPTPEKSLTKISSNRIICSDKFPAGKFDFCVLAVKPNLINYVLDEAKGFLVESNPVLVSVAAGISYEFLLENSPKGISVIRSMPNTPVAYGAGLFGYYCNQRNEEFENIFKSCGKIIYFDDQDKMHGFTALAGSGPAYIFHIIEAMSIAGRNVGLSKEESLKIARQMVIGSVLLAHNSPNSDITDLRKNVTSPNGTTEAGLKSLMKNDNLDPEKSRLIDIFSETLKAAQNRSYELAKT